MVETTLVNGAVASYSTPVQPVQVRLELSAYCNAHCVPCHRSIMTRPQGHISMDLVKKCLEDIRAFSEPLIEVVPTGWGELFLNPSWATILELIAQRLPFTRMVIPTNGTLLDGNVERLASIRTLRLVNLSVNAHIAETYEAFHKLPASNLAKIERAARRLRELRPDVVIWASMARDSQYQSPREVELFKEHWGKLAIVQVSQAEYAGVPGREPLVPVSLPCRSLFSDMAIAWDGRVNLCCYDANVELCLGSVAEDSLLNIWHGKAASQLRQLHGSGRRAEVSICRRCTFA